LAPHLLRWCNWRGLQRIRNAYLCRAPSFARPSTSAHRRHHRSGGSTIDIAIVVPASHVVGLINRSRVNHPPETSVVLCVMLRQERGLPLRCLLGQQHHRLSLSSPLHLHAIDSCRCTSLAHGILQLFKFFADFKHRRCATMALSRTFLCVVALPPQQLQEPRCVTTPTSSPSSSTTLLPASLSHPRLLRLLRSDNRELRRHSRHTAPQPSWRSFLLAPLGADTYGSGPLPCTSGIGNTNVCLRPQRVFRFGKHGARLASSTAV
jgi:hypothetical protein